MPQAYVGKEVAVVDPKVIEENSYDKTEKILLTAEIID